MALLLRLSVNRWLPLKGISIASLMTSGVVPLCSDSRGMEWLKIYPWWLLVGLRLNMWLLPSWMMTEAVSIVGCVTILEAIWAPYVAVLAAGVTVTMLFLSAFVMMSLWLKFGSEEMPVILWPDYSMCFALVLTVIILVEMLVMHRCLLLSVGDRCSLVCLVLLLMPCLYRCAMVMAGVSLISLVGGLMLLCEDTRN